MRRWIVLATITLMTLSLVAATKSASPAPTPTVKKAAPKATKKAPAKSAAKKVAAKPLAPDTVAHPIALFLSQMCGDGKKRVTFKASAVGTRFFIEEPTGVTIYGFDGTAYRKESFVKGSTIEKVLKRYAVRAGMS